MNKKSNYSNYYIEIFFAAMVKLLAIILSLLFFAMSIAELNKVIDKGVFIEIPE